MIDILKMLTNIKYVYIGSEVSKKNYAYNKAESKVTSGYI
jgi:hypothetical protein